MIYTDALQTLIMVVGAVILTIKGERGGRGGLHCQDRGASTGWGWAHEVKPLGSRHPPRRQPPVGGPAERVAHPGPARGLMESGRTISGPQSRPGLWPNCSKSLA